MIQHELYSLTNAKNIFSQHKYFLSECVKVATFHRKLADQQLYIEYFQNKIIELLDMNCVFAGNSFITVT